MFKKLAVLTIALFLTFAVVSVEASSGSIQAEINTSTELWQSYTDPRFDFTVEYPIDWHVIPRDDSNPQALSGILIFVPNDITKHAENGEDNLDAHEEVPQIIIGLYLAEQTTDQTLEQWTERYEAMSNDYDEALMRRQSRRVLEINRANAVREEGVSPLTTYQFTNLAHGKTVWFVWTNITSSAEEPYSLVYDHLVETFVFGRKSPTNLRQVYGESFKSLRLVGTQIGNSPINSGSGVQTKMDLANLENFPSIFALGSDWKSPVKFNSSGQPRNVRCGSEAHNNNTGGTYSKHAADIGVGSLTSVYAAMGGTVTFSGWANNGYGNLITVKAADGKEAYYAHLSHFFPMAGSQTYTLTLIALSGNSSTDPNMPYHLHFHVRQGTSSVDLTGMSGFTNYGNYPGTPGVYENCGSMGR